LIGPGDFQGIQRMDGLFSYALWALISLIVIGSGVAVLVW